MGWHWDNFSEDGYLFLILIICCVQIHLKFIHTRPKQKMRAAQSCHVYFVVSTQQRISYDSSTTAHWRWRTHCAYRCGQASTSFTHTSLGASVLLRDNGLSWLVTPVLNECYSFVVKTRSQMIRVGGGVRKPIAGVLFNWPTVIG